MKVKIKKVSDLAIVPEYKTEGAAGCDLHSIEEVVIKPNSTVLIKTGLQFEIPEGFFMLLAPRSSLVMKNNLDMPNSIGIIDSDYRGEVLIALRNLGMENVIIEKGERIAQLLIMSSNKAEFELVENLNESLRGSSGFGSTGKF